MDLGTPTPRLTCRTCGRTTPTVTLDLTGPAATQGATCSLCRAQAYRSRAARRRHALTAWLSLTAPEPRTVIDLRG